MNQPYPTLGLGGLVSCLLSRLNKQFKGAGSLNQLVDTKSASRRIWSWFAVH
ncbi:MAG: hypothetical protein IM477_01315 [Microcystis sp. M090S1]|uniref:hypothetical protein n=1 Tax=Microcystis sp. M090S1 TaxID=2771135 RepID=UPI00258FBFD6|nr:hypothetical protein [Microcystis sp. M090S1]MCA2811247.1 hypothetical protein [Microcystis sp. M090S1]